MRTVKRQMGDVTVTIELPDGCPAPRVQLDIHTSFSTANERAAAVRAFGLRADHVHTVGWLHTWARREDDEDSICAVVHFASDDPGVPDLFGSAA